MVSFVASVRKEEGSDYGVEFPDVPGHLAMLEAEGEPVPAPSTMEALKDDPH